MNQEVLDVAFENNLDDEAIDQLKRALSYFGEDVQFHEVPKSGPQASILLLGFTSIALVFGGAFVKKLGDKAAEDCYPHIKSALSKIYEKYFGKHPKYKIRIITTSENKSPDTKYSLVFALYCVGQENERVKFLYETEWSEEQFEMATALYIRSMIDFVGSGTGAVKDLLANNPPRIQPYLVAWDADSNLLVKGSALPENVQI